MNETLSQTLLFGVAFATLFLWKENIINEKSKKSPEYYKAIKIMDEFSEENRTIGRLQLKNINELKDYIKKSNQVNPL